MELTEYQCEVLKRLKDGDRTAEKAAIDLAYRLLIDAFLIIDRDMDRELRFRLRAAAVGLLDELNWHLDWEDNGKNLARKCEDLALMLKRYDYEMMKRR